MATIEQGLVSFVTADAGIVAWLDKRFYPLTIPQDADLPAAAYQRISGPRDRAHDGPTGLAFARIQVTIHCDTYAAVKSVGEVFRLALDGYEHGTWGAVTIESCFLENEIDNWSDRFAVPVLRLDFGIWYQE